MKLYSKDGQALVNIKAIDADGDNLKVKAKLMNAYNTDIMLTPYELYQVKGLLKKGIISHLLHMFRLGRKAEPMDEKKPTFTA